MNKVYLNHADVLEKVEQLYDKIINLVPPYPPTIKLYAVPRGGIPVAYLLVGRDNIFQLVNDPKLADFFIDDIQDSGDTAMRHLAMNHHARFLTLIFKSDYPGSWIVFPWEVGEQQQDNSFTDNVVRLLQFVGEDPTREGLLETPTRVGKAWQEWCSGYNVDIAALFKSFSDGGERYNQMVTVKDIPFYSHCEHHLAPFFGTATVSYIPNKRIVGLSKLSRVVQAYAKRLQVQERLTDQIADAINEHLEPLGVGVAIQARHLCMESRGISQQGHTTQTTALRGTFADEPSCRSEFLNILR
jgi:GTP cyclohydrolase I